MANGFSIMKSYQIHKLTEDEIANPYLVIEDLFSFGHLPDLREILWLSFKAIITGNFPEYLTNKERNDIVNLYEYLERLVEAVHLINEERRTNRAS